MAWIKFDKDLVNDPRIIRAAGGLAESYTLSIERSKGDGFAIGNDLSQKEATDLMRNAVIGALVTLWVYADTHIRNGDLLPISMEEINQMVGIDGFCEMVGPEWIQEANYGVHTVLPGYCEKNGLLSREKRRADNAERQRRYRERHNAESNADSNGVSNADVTALDLDQDLDLEKKKSNTGSRKNGAHHALPDDSPILEKLPLRDGSEFPIRQSLVSELEPLYPAVDIPSTLREMKGWLLLNAERRKTRAGVRRFIGNWLQSEQAKHGG